VQELREALVPGGVGLILKVKDRHRWSIEKSTGRSGRRPTPDRQTHEVVIDIMKSLQTLHRETFKHTQTVKKGKLEFRIPCFEIALTMKFGAMLSPYLDEKKKYFAAGDFIAMMHLNPALDEDRLLRLGAFSNDGGGKGIVKMVRKGWAGEKLIL